MLVLKYPVSTIRRYAVLSVGSALSEGLPLLAPTVLDGEFSGAFCPAPENAECGYTLDLSVSLEAPLIQRREILHPPVRWRCEHLWRVGTIARPVPEDRLRTARGLHLLDIRELLGRPDYASGTDEDLLS